MAGPNPERRNGDRWIALTILGALSFGACEMEAPVPGDAGYPQVTSDSGCVCTYSISIGGFSPTWSLVPLSCLCGASDKLCPNYVSVVHQGGFVGSESVYDATTHELVGRSWGGDTPSQDPCGTMAYSVHAGTFPAPDCKATQTGIFCPASEGELCLRVARSLIRRSPLARTAASGKHSHPTWLGRLRSVGLRADLGRRFRAPTSPRATQWDS